MFTRWVVFFCRVAAGQNSSGGPAGRGHHYKDRERLEEAQHAHALPGLLVMFTQGLQVTVICD